MKPLLTPFQKEVLERSVAYYYTTIARRERLMTLDEVNTLLDEIEKISKLGLTNLRKLYKIIFMGR